MPLETLQYGLTNYLVALAQEYRARGFSVTYQPFVYGADWLPLAASGTASRVVTIEHDADFVWCFNTQTVFTVAAFVQNPNILLRFTSETSQRQFQNAQTHMLNVCGTGQRPFPWYKPVVFSAKSSFTIEAQDLSATEQSIRLGFHGVKAFLAPAA